MDKIPIVDIKKASDDTAAGTGFTICDLKSLLLQKERVRGLHRHNFFFILAVKQGSGLHEIDFEQYEIFNNTIFCLRPGQVHHLKLNSEAEGFLMRFNTNFYQPFDKVILQSFRKATHKNLCPLENERFERLFSILSNILREYSKKEGGYLNIIKASLDIFFIELVRQSKRPADEMDNITSYKQERLEEFLDLLQTNIAQHKQVSHYTQLMNLSAYQLNDITKTTIGKTASEVINDQIILEAKRSLLALDLQVKVISEQLGYEDVSYFIRFFKKHTGYSPEAYRKNLR